MIINLPVSGHRMITTYNLEKSPSFYLGTHECVVRASCLLMLNNARKKYTKLNHGSST